MLKSLLLYIFFCKIYFDFFLDDVKIFNSFSIFIVHGIVSIWRKEIEKNSIEMGIDAANFFLHCYLMIKSRKTSFHLASSLI